MYALFRVFITHDLGAANYMSDRIAVMYAGRIQESGPASEVMGEPKHPYTQLLRRAAPNPENKRQEGAHFESKGDPRTSPRFRPAVPSLRAVL